ncbi:acyl-CoA thioesterase [Actinosynnema pretiosum subsp. pretiosum]|uniref:Thioesterase superfamily protein n=2 Tax=Actinosynnema TaxID=40566 RepID=C6WS18_ACTMD|nr:thioesterase family protein [Actinosynnema mirum]ACU38838.1 thioesterase superfamily protein [Actinosynnema mirum DSM 43827]AXX32430.1 putative 4-hydroxybenzoyl-CoA thioesterase [Actinosynnema pretiosum subsp. pretiosum]QUF03642.1 acyl-CoA thioesterase [Actinosynnema pretiosum subsp. pretiosum]
MREHYPHWQRVPTRWGDNDVYGHVNNVVHYAFMDTVINTWLIGAGLDIHGGPAIGLCVESHCSYRAAVAFPDALDAGLRVGKLGGSSVRYEVGFYREGADELVAQGHFVHVFTDRGTRRPVPIPDGLRAAMTGLVVP